MNKLHVAVATALAACGTTAMAADNPEGFYLGAGLGDYSADINGLEGVDDADIDFSTDESASRIFGGWRFNRFVSVNVDYTDFGRSAGAIQELPVTADTRGFTPSVIGTLPVGPVELYGKAGVIFYDLDIDAGDGDLSINESGQDAVVGVGIGVTLLDRLNLKAEYEKIDIDEFDDADSVWLTASWRF